MRGSSALLLCSLSALLLCQSPLALAQGSEDDGSIKVSLQLCQSELRGLKDHLSKQTAELTRLRSERADEGKRLGGLQQRVAVLEAELQKARESSEELDWATVSRALSKACKSKLGALQTEVLTVVEEAKAGKFGRVQVLSLGLLDSSRGAASTVYAFVATEADEHLPPAVKDKLRAWASAVSTTWHTHVVEAAWAAPLVTRVKAVNQELKGFLVAQMRTVPALHPYTDPSFVQLMVYALFGLPILLVVILPLALMLTTRKAEEAPSVHKSKSKGKRSRA